MFGKSLTRKEGCYDKMTDIIESINNYFSRDTFEVENQMMPENSMKTQG